MMHPDTPWPHANHFHAELTLPSGFMEARPVPPPDRWLLWDDIRAVYNEVSLSIVDLQITGGLADVMRTRLFLEIVTEEHLPLGNYMWSFEFNPIKGVIMEAAYVPIPAFPAEWRLPNRIDLITGGRGVGRSRLIVQHLVRHALRAGKPAVLFVGSAERARFKRAELADQGLADWVWVTSTDGHFTQDQDWSQFCVAGLDLYNRVVEPDRVPVPVAVMTVQTSGPLEIR